MIIVYHIAGLVSTVEDDLGNPVSYHKKVATEVLLECAKQFQEELIIWCNEQAREFIDLKDIKKLFYHRRLMLSYGDVTQPYFSKHMGYIEDSPFIKVNPAVTYPTWQMHSFIGGLQASVLNAITTKLDTNTTLDFFLNTLSRKLQQQGLICQSEPRLLKESSLASSQKATSKELYAFIKQNYKKRWLLFMLLMQARYEKTFSVFTMMGALFLEKKTALEIDFNKITWDSELKIGAPFTVDVVIPTLGRKKYLHNVLLDFKNQTHLPERIIIVEQNPEPHSKTALDYIASEEWPFETIHIFTHQTGACNARNLAITKSSADWVFLFDDDGRLDHNVLNEVRLTLEKTGALCINMSYLQTGEVETNKRIRQWPYFGSGCSLVHKSIINKASFDMALEHGYGEDVDFGMQIRNLGADVLYVPQIQITHLKAPTGGFRSVPTFPWKDEKIQPKPSPQIMYHRTKNTTKEQLRGYKWVLFFKYFRSQSIKNPFTYVRYYKKAWSSSRLWASKLPLDG